jgi:glycine/serine hydroxymethyltransferase
VLLSEIGLPGPDHDPAGAIRIGTQSIASQGFGPDDMPAVAAIINASLHNLRPAGHLREEVAHLRRRQRDRQP